MSKSRKKQKARERAREDAPPLAAEAVLEATVAPAPPPPRAYAQPGLKLTPKAAEAPAHLPVAPSQVGAAPALALDQALLDRVVAAATAAGVMREEGDQVVYLYNGDTLAIKYTEPGEEAGQPLRVMVAAFRQGVVFQVEGDRPVVHRPGDWELALPALAESAPPDEDEEPDPT